MRSSRSALLCSPFFSRTKRSVGNFVLLYLLLTSSLSFASAHDRITGPINQESAIRLGNGTQSAFRIQNDQGKVDSSFPLNHVTMLFTPSPSQQRAIDKLLEQQQNPNSANYHKWLTPEQYAERFGLSPNDIQKITAWLQSEGFSGISVERGGNSIVFSATAGQIEKTFQTEIHRYDAEGESRFTNTTPPQIPLALSGDLTGFRGLSNFHLKPNARRMNPEYYDAKSKEDFMAPGDAATIYDINPLYSAGIDGTGQKLAIIGQTDIYLADIADFRTGFGLSAIAGCAVDANNLITACNTPNFKYVLSGGIDPHTPSQGDLGEADIDVEWSGAVARNAQIIYVNAPDFNGNGVLDSMHYAIQNDVAPVVSMSYGLCEFFSAENAAGGFAVFTESEFQQANLQGMTIMNSTGDNGAAGCDAPFTPGLATLGYAVGYPASSPSVTAVGGSTVSYLNVTTGQYWSASSGSDGGSALSYIPELAWNDDEQFGLFCTANPKNTFCTSNAITNQFSAQNALGIFSANGGMSNCFTVDANGICTGGLPQPSWQNVKVAGLISGQTIPNPAPRLVPDVSLLASDFPGFITCTAQFEVGGSSSASTCATGIGPAVDTYGSIFIGTSIASPMFAGVVTLLNQYLGNANGMGNANPMLYKLAAVAAPAFHDITGGSNTAYCVEGSPAGQPASLLCPAPVAPDLNSKLGFTAATGYDLATGLGSVDVDKLAIAFKAPLPNFSAATSNSNLTAFPSGTAQATITITPVNSFSQAITFSCSGLPAGASCSFNPASVTPPTATSTVMTVQTTSSNSGTAAFSVVATTGVLSQLSHTVAESIQITANQFTWTNTGSTSSTVLSGQVAAYGTNGFVASPSGGATTFAADVTFSCSGLPDATTACVFSPSKITQGAGATPVTLTITTTGPNSVAALKMKLRQRSDKRSPWLPLALPLSGIVMLGVTRRRFSRQLVVAGLCISVVFLTLMVACGGGGSSSPPAINVAVSQGTPSSVFPNDATDAWPNQTAQFTATVTNTTNTAVTWSVSPANGGTIDATGLYTAPTVAVGLPTRVTIKATSVADSTKTGSSQEALSAATVPGTYNGISVIASEPGAAPNSQNVHLIVQ